MGDSVSFSCKNSRGLTIKGDIFWPDETGNGTPSKEVRPPYKAVILSHGFRGNRTDLYEQCEFFRGLGYAAVTYSFCGGSQDDTPEEKKSEGSSVDMSVFSEVEDLLTVYEYTVSLDNIDKESIILYGESQGGYVSGVAAGRLGSSIHRLIMLYPALCIPDHARRGILGGAKYDPANVPDRIDCGGITLGRRSHDEQAAVDPYLLLEKYPGEVLIIHGLADDIVDYRYTVMAGMHYGDDRCVLKFIDGAGHGFNGEKQQCARETIVSFLSEQR